MPGKCRHRACLRRREFADESSTVRVVQRHIWHGRFWKLKTTYMYSDRKNINLSLWARKLPAIFSETIFGMASTPTPHGHGGNFSDLFVSEDGVWIWVVMGFHRLWEATSVVENKPKAVVQPASICQATGVLLLLVVLCYPPARASGITTSRSDGIVMVSTTRALPLSSQLRLRHSPSSTTTCLVEKLTVRRKRQPF